jgi:hypothetical protein
MSIFMPGDDFYPTDPEDVCLLCLQPFTDGEPVVMWASKTNIYLHGGCSGTFALRLARDAWQVERDANDGKYTLTARGSGWRMPPAQQPSP